MYYRIIQNVRMYYTGNADLSDGEDDELLPLDTEVGTTDDDQESQVDDDQENQVDDDQEIQLDDDQENQVDDDKAENQVDAVATAATTTTAAIVEEEDRPEFGPHRKLSRGEDLFEFRKEVEMVREKKFVCSLELFLDLWGVVEHQGVVKSLRSSIILWGPLLLLLPSAKLGTFSSLPHLGR